MIVAHIGLTKLGTASAELWQGDLIIAKVYPSADGKRIRIVLPELYSFKQSRIDVDSHYIDFEREVK